MARTAPLPTPEALALQFLREERYPVRLVSPRISLGTFTYSPWGYVGCSVSLGGSDIDVGEFAIDVAKTGARMQFDIVCDDADIGDILQKKILQVLNEQVFADVTWRLVPTDSVNPSISSLRLEHDKEIKGVLTNGPFEAVPRMMFPEGSKEFEIIKAAISYRTLCAQRDAILHSAPPYAATDAAAEKLRALLEAA